MNPIDFIFRLFASHLQFSQEEFESVRAQAIAGWDASTGKLKTFFSSPWVLLLLPILLPILKGWIDRLLARWIGDQDEDGDIDVADALAAIVEKLQRQKQQQ